MAVTLYRQVGKGKARNYQKINLGRKSPTPFISGSLSLRSFKAKTNKAKARRPCGRTTTARVSSLTSLLSRICDISIRSIASTICGTLSSCVTMRAVWTIAQFTTSSKL